MVENVLGGVATVEPDAFNRGVGAGIAAKESAGGQIDPAARTLLRAAKNPAVTGTGGEKIRGDAPDLIVFAGEEGEISFGRDAVVLAAEIGRGVGDKDGFVADDPADFVVFAVTGDEVVLAHGPDPGVAFAGRGVAGTGVFEQGGDAGVVIGG